MLFLQLIVIFGAYILLNLFLAILLENFGSVEEEEQAGKDADQEEAKTAE